MENNETAITVEQLQKQLEVFNQQNYENYLKMQEIAKAQPLVKNRKLDRKKAQKDALRALEHPEEVLKEYLTTEVQDSVVEKQREVETQIYHLLSDETKEIYRQFLLQNQATEETFLQHIMNQPEEDVIREDVMESIKQMENPNDLKQLQIERKEYMQAALPTSNEETDEELRQQILAMEQLQNSHIYEEWTALEEVIRQQSEHILKDSNRTISEDITRVLEKLTLIHPDQVSETESLIQEEEYKNMLKYVMHETETIDVQNEITKILEYFERKKLFNQIQQIMTANTEYLQPIVFETINQKIKQQMQVYEQLQTTNVYEKWMMPADVIWQIEQAESEAVEEHILKQKHVEKQFNRQQIQQHVLWNQKKTEEVFQNIDFVHKVEEQVLNEELLEEIRMQREQTKKQEYTEQTTLENKTTHQQMVQETVNHMQTTQLNQIEELVQQSVKRQIGDLSDQVYGKIEKKLQTERKRRGYF